MKSTRRNRCLFTAMLLTMLYAVSLSAIAESGFLTAREMLARDEVAPFIELGGDEIPSVYSVVGWRAIHEAESSVDPNGGLHERRAYKSESVSGDLYAYAEHLTANGWEELKGPTGIVHGEIAFAKPSVDDGLTLTVALSYDADGYLFTATLQEGVAWEASGWTPRKTALISPQQSLGAPRPLAGGGVPAAYTEASTLAMRDGRMAYVPFFAESNVCEAEVGPDWDWDTMEYFTYDRVRGILLQENGIVCLLDEGDVKLAICEPFEEPKYVLPELPEELPEEELVSIGGPLMQLADGTLLFLDRTGSLYVCGADGSSLRAVPGVRADSFVYYGGFVYFTNLNDQMTHWGVYDAVAYEYSDFSYPRLYRVALDGTGLTRLTDCGVRGLTAQGPYIIYQNLDEPYTLPKFELSGKSILHGPLYCYDADVGEHRALDIESDAYLPTPWGLAVWYHDFSIEPYDIEAELVLHGYDGTPLYRLDAGTAEFTGASCVYGDALCFYAFDWSYYWEEGGESAIFSMVPLDGQPRGEITSLLDDVE